MKEAILILLLALIVSTKATSSSFKNLPNPQERNCLYSQTKQRNADEGAGKVEG